MKDHDRLIRLEEALKWMEQARKLEADRYPTKDEVAEALRKSQDAAGEVARRETRRDQMIAFIGALAAVAFVVIQFR